MLHTAIDTFHIEAQHAYHIYHILNTCAACARQAQATNNC